MFYNISKKMNSALWVGVNEMVTPIRIVSKEQGPLFCGKDVAMALGYGNGRDAVRRHVEDEDKTTVAICDTGSNYKTNAVCINESGLYSLILGSNLAGDEC